jgi:hypothetical protein
MRLEMAGRIRELLHLEVTFARMAHDFEARVAQLHGEDADDEDAERALARDRSPRDAPAPRPVERFH